MKHCILACPNDPMRVHSLPFFQEGLNGLQRVCSLNPRGIDWPSFLHSSVPEHLTLSLSMPISPLLHPLIAVCAHRGRHHRSLLHLTRQVRPMRRWVDEEHAEVRLEQNIPHVLINYSNHLLRLLQLAMLKRSQKYKSGAHRLHEAWSTKVT